MLTSGCAFFILSILKVSGLEVFQELFPVACEWYLRPFSASFPFIFVALIHAYLADITQDK